MTGKNLAIKQTREARRERRVRTRIKTAGLPRLSVFRSNRYIWAQVIDDTQGITLASATSKGLASGTKTEKAFEVGKKIADSVKGKKIQKIVFDRGRYQYHGQVEAVARGAREGGLQF